MATVLNTVADYLLRQSWQLLAIFGLVLAGSWVLRKASAHWRYLLWLVVVAKCLTPPMFSFPLAVLPHDVESKPAASVAKVLATPRASEAKPSISDLNLIPSPTLARQAMVASPSMPASSPGASNHFDLRRWLVMAWMLVAGMIFTLVAGKAWTTDRKLKRARRPADDEIRNMVASLAKVLGMSRAPTVYSVALSAQPFVWGWIRGDIYVPLQFAKTVSPEQQRAILTHELAHVARWDAAVNHFQIIVQAIFFFHPLVWWTNKKIRQEREKCCDEIVVSGLGNRPQLYCEAIVEMLTLEYQARHSSPELAVTGSTKNIQERIATILTPDRKFHRRPSSAAIITLLLVAACVLPTAFIVTSHAAAPDTKTSDTIAWQTGQAMDFRVINAQTQKPIPDVSLELQNQGPGIDFQDVKVQTTDADGRSIIKLPNFPPTAVRVYPSKPGFVPLRVYWAGAPAPVMPKSITIPMEPGKEFGGAILNEAGDPIPNVAVEVHYWATGSGENPHLRANIDAKATSDKDGRWRVNVMPAKIDKDLLRIYLTHPGYVSDHLKRAIISMPVTEQPPIEQLFDQTAVMVMRKGDTIQGQVSGKDGQPIQNAKIHNSEYYWFGPKPRAATDGDGNFVISGIQPVMAEPLRPLDIETILTVEATGYAPDLIDVARANSPLKIQLEPGQSVHGRVVDEDGNPVEGVTLFARRWRKQSNRLHLEAKSDAEGNFRLSDVPMDEVEYDLSKDGYMMVENFPMAPAHDKYSVTMKAPVTIVGSVVDAETGKPLDKFLLRKGIDYADGRAPDWPGHLTSPMSNGKYKTTLTQEGFAYRVRVEADGYMLAESRMFRPYDPDKGEITCDFKLSKAAPLTGTVIDADGKPLAGASVYLATDRINITDRQVNHYGTNRTVKTDEAGRFTFPAEFEPFCLVAVHEQGIAMINDVDLIGSVSLSIQPWTNENQTLQIIRRPAPGEYVNFPNQFP